MFASVSRDGGRRRRQIGSGTPSGREFILTTALVGNNPHHVVTTPILPTPPAADEWSWSRLLMLVLLKRPLEKSNIGAEHTGSFHFVCEASDLILL